MPSAPAPGLVIASWLDCPGCDRAGRILQLLTSTSHPHCFLNGSKVGGFILEFRLCRQVQHTNPILTPHQWQRAFALILEEYRPRWGSRDCCLPAQKHLWEQQLPLLTEQAYERGRLTPLCPHRPNRLLKTTRLRKSPQSTLQGRYLSGCLQRYTEAWKARRWCCFVISGTSMVWGLVLCMAKGLEEVE